MTKHCRECGRLQRVSEQFAFRGMDRLRCTLACGHIVLRDQPAEPNWDPRPPGDRWERDDPRGLDLVPNYQRDG